MLVLKPLFCPVHTSQSLGVFLSGQSSPVLCTALSTGPSQSWSSCFCVKWAIKEKHSSFFMLEITEIIHWEAVCLLVAGLCHISCHRPEEAAMLKMMIWLYSAGSCSSQHLATDHKRASVPYEAQKKISVFSFPVGHPPLSPEFYHPFCLPLAKKPQTQILKLTKSHGHCPLIFEMFNILDMTYWS